MKRSGTSQTYWQCTEALMSGLGWIGRGVTLTGPLPLLLSFCLLLLGFSMLQDACGSTPGSPQLSVVPYYPASEYKYVIDFHLCHTAHCSLPSWSPCLEATAHKANRYEAESGIERCCWFVNIRRIVAVGSFLFHKRLSVCQTCAAAHPH